MLQNRLFHFHGKPKLVAIYDIADNGYGLLDRYYDKSYLHNVRLALNISVDFARLNRQLSLLTLTHKNFKAHWSIYYPGCKRRKIWAVNIHGSHLQDGGGLVDCKRSD